MAEVILLMPETGLWERVRNPFPPLGLLYASSFVAKEFETILIDMRLNGKWRDEILKHIDSSTICVAAPLWTGHMIKSVLDAFLFVKKEKCIKTVVGGPHASLMPFETVSHPYVDFVVQGEGEIAFLELLMALKERRDFKWIEGLWWKGGGNPSKRFLDLSTLPEVPYHLIDVKNYMGFMGRRKSFPLEASRGCPFSCRFCYQKTYSRSMWRPYPIDMVFNRAKTLVERYGVEDIYFIDDEFFVDRERVLNLGRRLKTLNITWQVQGGSISTLKRMSAKNFEEMRECGCVRITIGIESGSERTLGILGKKFSSEEAYECIKRIVGAGISVYISMMGGVPGEEVKDIYETIDFILKILKISKRVYVSPIYSYTPFPGTEIYEKLKEEFSFPKDLNEWGNYSYEDNPYIKNKKFNSLLKRLYFLTLLCDEKMNFYSNSSILKILAKIYKPISLFRLRHRFFSFMIEFLIWKWLFLRRYNPCKNQQIFFIRRELFKNLNFQSDFICNLYSIFKA